MFFTFSTPVLIRQLWQLKTLLYLHCCPICSVILFTYQHLLLQVVKVLIYIQMLFIFASLVLIIHLWLLCFFALVSNICYSIDFQKWWVYDYMNKWTPLTIDSLTQYVDDSRIYVGCIPNKEMSISTKGVFRLGNSVLMGSYSSICPNSETVIENPK